MSWRALQPTYSIFFFFLATLAGCQDSTAPVDRAKPQFAQGDGGVWTVNSLADPGDGACTDDDCTLREAIAAASAGGRIVFASGLSGVIELNAGALAIAKSLTIDGSGISVDARFESRVFFLSGGAVVTLAGLELWNGEPAFDETGGFIGGGVYVTGAGLTLDGVAVRSGNASTGGGLYVDVGANATIRNSTFILNGAFSGAAIRNDGSLTLVRSSLVASHAFGNSVLLNRGSLSVIASTIGGSISGGGIWNDANATATLVRSTVSGNHGQDMAGGIQNLGTLVLRSSTVAENGAVGWVGGIYNAGSLTLTNSIVAGNSGDSTPEDCGGPNAIVSAGHNLTTTGGGCPSSGTGDVQVALAQLGTDVLDLVLEENGGPTRTHALRAGSPAVDAGSCPGETEDQRGFTRPVDNPFVANATNGCDIGAYELQLTAAQQVTVIANQISALSLASGTANSFQAKLNAVLAAIEAGDTAGACSSLTAFINEVRAQAGKKKISATDAAALIDKATALKTELGCP